MSRRARARRNLGGFSCALATAAALTGCGGSRHSGITNPDAVAFGQAVNLHSRDLRGVTGHVIHLSDLYEPPWGERVDRCGGRVGRTGKLVAIQSPSFRNVTPRSGTTSSSTPHVVAVSSTVYVAPSATLPRQDLAAAARAVRSGCVGRSFAESAHESFREEHATVTLLPSPAPRIPAYGLRLASVEGQVRGYTDTFGFAMGPAEVLLTAVGLDKPVGADTERRLLSLLYNRAHQLQPLLEGKKALIIE